MNPRPNVALKNYICNLEWLLSCQAMPDGGDLFLETQIVTLEEPDTNPYGALPGKYAKVSVTDSGIGISPSNLQRVFDPFFTTKEKGHGTGLGLASAYGIVKNHSGIITGYSEVGWGSTFNVYLPVANSPAHLEAASVEGIVKGSETVLLVDDEEMITEVGKGMLEKLGYRVFIANSGEQAVDILGQKGGEIDLVVLDLIMPGMKGDKAFDLIREIRPFMAVLLASGYAINGQASDLMRKGCNGFIQKPFRLSDLSQKVRKILDETKEAKN